MSETLSAEDANRIVFAMDDFKRKHKMPMHFPEERLIFEMMPRALATIEALQAEVTTLRTALEEAKVAAETTADLIEASHYEPAEMQAAQSAVDIAHALEALHGSQ